MEARDQALRSQAQFKPGQRIDADELARWQAADEANTARLKEIVAAYGWPGYTLVGKDGAEAAWLLAQHADLDREFQRQCLSRLEKAVAGQEADPQHLAYLTDRLRVADQLPQVYGTQVQFLNGEPIPFEIEDGAKVDERRAAIGLGPLVEYLKLFQPGQ